ncbi:MAG: sodium:proton antiporter NhaD [Bacteroidetes bacterium]|nr:sodium:proton antiporter NhaD [Bacteroidota bacterium]
MILFILITFFIGYLFIILEHKVKIDKAASALLMGVSCWVIYILNAADPHTVNDQLAEHISDIAGILFFLIGAMTIVELIDLHEGFQVIIDAIKTTNKRTLIIIISLITFFLSAILDNLTTAIVMSTLVAKILSDQRDKNIVIGMVIIAANSGGAWSPIGDVTTTMLWIGNQITAVGIMKSIFLPSLVSVCVPLFFFLTKIKGRFSPKKSVAEISVEPKERVIIFYSGISLLIFVPIFKTFTHLAPYMGMMFAVGIVWLISETLHKKKPNNTEQQPSIFVALEKVDLPSILFFMGILLAVSALQSTSILQNMATTLSSKVQNENIIVIGIGLLSAIFDNVPLVAAIQGMFSKVQYPTGHFFWNFLAYCAGTGGSILIIGSAAGVAAMGIEKISFFWYLKNVSFAALLGYLAGALTTILIG